jgi:1,4-dihydroxy-2-naphthoate octaprenyltransferase
MGEHSINLEKIKLLVEIGRLRFLAGGFFLYTLGSLLAISTGIDFSIVYFLFGYAIMLPAHLSLSYSNNYFDTDVDKLNNPTAIAGGTKILINNPDLKPICKKIAIGLIILSIVLATVFVLLFSYPIIFLVFIVFGNLLGWFYSAPPLKLAYRGLGEVANMINMGLLMPGIGYWAISGNLDSFFLIFSIPFFVYGLDFMIIVETPDFEGDKKAEKKTLVTRLGRKNSYKVIIISLLSSSFYFLFLSYFGFYNSYISYSLIYIFSLIPLFVGIYGWFKQPFTKKIASNIAEKNMYALLTFIIITNIYLILS